MDQRGLRQEMLAMLHDNTSVEPGLLASAHFVRGGSALPVPDGGASKAADKLEVRVKEEPGTTRPSLAGRRESQKMDRALQELQVQREKMRREQEVWIAAEMSGLECKEAHLLALKLRHTTEMENLEAAKQEQAQQQKFVEASVRAMQRDEEVFSSLMGAERVKLEKEKEAVAKEIAGMRSGVEVERQKMMAEVKSMRQRVLDRKQAGEEEVATLRRIIEKEREDMERDVEAQRAAARGEVERLLAEAIAEREKAREVREAIESEMAKVEEKQLAVGGKEEALEAGLAQLAEDRLKLKAEIEEEICGQIAELRDERNEVRLEREALQAELGALNGAHARLAAEKTQAVSIQKSTTALQEAARVVCKQTTQLKKERKRLAAAKVVDTEPEAEAVAEPEAVVEPEAGQTAVEKCKKSSGWLSRLGLFGPGKGGVAEGGEGHVKCSAPAEASPPPLLAGTEDEAVAETTPGKAKDAAVSGDKVVETPGGTKKRTQQDMEGGGGEGQVAPGTPAEKEVAVESHDAAKKAKLLVCMAGLSDSPNK